MENKQCRSIYVGKVKMNFLDLGRDAKLIGQAISETLRVPRRH